jgi:hypothetical protein
MARWTVLFLKPVKNGDSGDQELFDHIIGILEKIAFVPFQNQGDF